MTDIISMVKHASDEQERLVTSDWRVDAALARLTARQAISDDQRRWFDRIREHVVQNLSIDRDDFGCRRRRVE